MSDPTNPYHPPAETTDSASATSSQQNMARPHPGRKLVWTLVPIPVYLIAYQMNIPTFNANWFPGMIMFSDFHALTAVGLIPWFFAAVVVQLFLTVFRSDRRATISHAGLNRITNFMGLVFAILNSAWVVFSWTRVGGILVAILGIPEFMPSASIVTSPILGFASLASWTILFRVLIHFALPRSLFAQNARLLAVIFLLPLLHSLIVNEFSIKYMNGGDTIRMFVTCFQCAILIAFIFLNPTFFSPEASRDSAAT